MRLFTTKRREYERFKQYLQQKGVFMMPLAEWEKIRKSWSTTGNSEFSSLASPAEQISSGYESVVWYYAAANLRAKCCCKIPFKLFRRGRDGNDEEVQDDKTLWQLNARPNPFKSAYDLRLFYHLSLYVTGNAFYYMPKGNRLAIWNVPPASVRIEAVDAEVDPLNLCIYYIQEKGKEVPYRRDQILHWMLPNLNSLISGLSPIAVARQTIEAHRAGKDWNLSLVKRGGKKSGFFTTDQAISQPDFEKLKTEINEKFNTSSQIGGYALLDQGLKMSEIGVSPRDMDWLESQRLTLREICALLEVPGELLGDTQQKTYANAETALKSFYINTVLPTVDNEAKLYTAFFWPNSNFYLVPDTSGLDILKKSDSELAAANASRWWWTANERRIVEGQEPMQKPGMDDVFVPANFIPIGGISGGGDEL